MAEPKTTDSLSRAAELSTFDEDARTVEVVFATATRVLRDTWATGKFWEELVVSRAACDLKRLNLGAPFLNAHGGAYDALSVMGAVVQGSAKIEGGQGIARIKFDTAENDPDAEKLFRKVQQKILTGVSVGYRVLEMKKTKEEVDGVPVYRVTKWEPYEISVAPIPADIESSFRSLNMPEPEETIQTTENVSRAAPAVLAQAAQPVPAVDVAAERAAAASAERKRVQDITALVRAAKLEQSVADGFVSEGVALEAARAKVLDLVIARDSATEKPRGGITGTDIGADSVREGATAALLHRFSPDRYQLSDNARRFRGLSLLELGERSIALHGGKVSDGLSKMERAAMVLGLSVRGAHSTSDFPLLLADAAGKVLRDSYKVRESSFQQFSRRVTLPDFRDRKVLQLGDAPALAPLGEGGEIKAGTLTEGRETWKLATYARRVSITRQLIVNDDLDAMLRIPQLFGRSAVDVQSNVFYTHLQSNPIMGDSIALFHASRSPSNTTTGVYSQTLVSAARTAMRRAKGLGADGIYLDCAPKFALIPPEVETTFDKENALIVAAQSSNANPFTGLLTKVVEPRLAAAPIYFVADPAAIDTAEYGFLEGEDGPQLESRNGWEVEGVEIKCRLDFGAKIIEPRAFFFSTGV